MFRVRDFREGVGLLVFAWRSRCDFMCCSGVGVILGCIQAVQPRRAETYAGPRCAETVMHTALLGAL